MVKPTAALLASSSQTSSPTATVMMQSLRRSHSIPGRVPLAAVHHLSCIRAHAASHLSASQITRKQPSIGAPISSHQPWHGSSTSISSMPLQPLQWGPRQRCRRHRTAATSASAVAGAAAGAAAAWSTTAHAAQLLAARLGVYAAQIGAYLPFLPAAVHALQSALQSAQLPPLPTLDMAGAHIMSSTTIQDLCPFLPAAVACAALGAATRTIAMFADPRHGQRELNSLGSAAVLAADGTVLVPWTFRIDGPTSGHSTRFGNLGMALQWGLESGVLGAGAACAASLKLLLSEQSHTNLAVSCLQDKRCSEGWTAVCLALPARPR